MAQEIDSFDLRIIPLVNGAFDVFLVDSDGKIAAESHYTPTGPAPRMRTAAAGRDIGTALNAKPAGEDDYDIDTVDNSPLVNFRAFSNIDLRESLIDGAYSWLQSEICPDYDKPDIQTQDGRFVLYADGKRVGGPAPKSSGQGLAASSGRKRPRSGKSNLGEIWF